MSPRWEPDPQLLANSLATVFRLGVLITLLGPVSGAHFNPAVIRLVRTTATAVWARTARVPMHPVAQGPANDAVTAGAATRKGPRWTSAGARMSTTVTIAINAIGTASRT
ncbi:aquaporin [Streptomyces sp. WAC00263]|uniref:aquaporin n=1 Tax=Streptomyces sp. WAC00263 TaxID=1917422 RepID=UPI001F50C9B3|nr:aquaporin [Streptomyces sp. WAC00263]